VLASAQQHGLAVESLTPDEIARRWPGFRVPGDMTGVFEAAAGYLKVERCVLAHIAAAKRLGAEFRFGSPLYKIDGAVPGKRSRKREFEGIEVTTHDYESFRARSLIYAVGPWAPNMLPHLDVRLAVRRKHVYWFSPADPGYGQDRGCPTFLYQLPHGVFYGFPQIDELGVKVAEHSGGVEVANPLTDSRELDPQDLARAVQFLSDHLPGVEPTMTRHSVCYYTMSPDEHFIVDRHPVFENTYFAAGLSGHGFKFTSVLGEALADLALEGKTSLPIGFLSWRRFGQAGRLPYGEHNLTLF
jgi:glycine/D-amino acid oxidase-like deaminating enzyme